VLIQRWQLLCSAYFRSVAQNVAVQRYHSVGTALGSSALGGSNRSGRREAAQLDDPSGRASGHPPRLLVPAPAVNAVENDWLIGRRRREGARWLARTKASQPIGARRRLLLIRPAVSLPVATKFKTPSDGHVGRQPSEGGGWHRSGRPNNDEFRFP